MKKNAKFFTLLLAISLIFCLNVPAFAAFGLPVEKGNCGAERDNVTYKLYSDGELVISGKGDMADWDGITQMSPFDEMEVTKLTVKDGVTSIGDNAFSACFTLEKIELANTVTKIGNFSFFWCELLQTVTIPASVKQIGERAFDACESLYEIKVDSKNTSFMSADGVLYDKNQTVLIHYPQAKTQTLYTIPDSVKVIEKSVFSGNENLQTITIGKNVESIGDEAFQYCGNLKSFTLPDSTKTIGEFVAYCCRNIKTVNIGSGLTKIGDASFLECESLENYVVSKDNKSFLSADGVLFNKDKTEIIGYPAAKNATEYKVPATVTKIGADAFAYAEKLESVTLPEGLLHIGESAFLYCINLKNLKLPSTLKTIGESAFAACFEFESIIIPDNVETIGEWAFENCEKVTKIYIPASVTSIGNYAFSFCPALESVEVDKNNADYTSENNVLFNKDKTELLFYPSTKTDKEYTVPDSVQVIGEYAIEFNGHLESIVLGKNVKTVKEMGISYCDNLKSITLYNSVELFDRYLMYKCEELKDIYFFGTKHEWDKIKPEYFEYTDIEVHFVKEQNIIILENEEIKLSESKNEVFVFEGLTVKDLKKSVLSKVDVVNTAGESVKDSESVATGMKIVIKDNNITVGKKTVAVLGDVDGDGKTSASDARLALRQSVGLESFSDIQKSVSDTDYDKKISASDARIILRLSVGLEDKKAIFSKIA